MPDLDFTVIGVAPATHGLTPLLHFKLGITNAPPDEAIQSVILQVQIQIQIQAPGRSYNESEKPELIDLFGTPDQWGTTLRARPPNRVWTGLIFFPGEAQN